MDLAIWHEMCGSELAGRTRVASKYASKGPECLLLELDRIEKQSKAKE